MLIAQAVSLLQRGQTDRQTDVTERPIRHAGGYTASVGNDPLTQLKSHSLNAPPERIANINFNFPK